ncbi:MAG: hypothetical protein RL258_1576, partial [Pseudomonadota bacterium]
SVLDKAKGALEGTAMLGTAIPAAMIAPFAKEFTGTPEDEFTSKYMYTPRTEAGLLFAEERGEQLGSALEAAGETPLGQALGKIVEKVPVYTPLLGAPAQAAGRISKATKKVTDTAQELTREGQDILRKGNDYETIQEGPFYRVRPASQRSGQAVRGNKEEAGAGAPDTGGAVRGDVPQPITDAQLTEIMAQPDNFVRSVASQYAEEVNGQPYELPEMAPSSLLKQAPIGRAFDLAVSEDPQYKKRVFEAYGQAMPEVIEQSGAKNYDQLVEAAYRQLAKETDAQFRRLPVSMSFHRAGEGNYTDSKDMLRDVYGNRHLYVFQGGDPHPFLNQVDPVTGLNDNEKFRAVHDFFGHAIHGNQFGPKGEETAWLAHSQMYSPLARLAMSTETRGQNSVVNYTPLNAQLKRSLSEVEGRIMEARRRGQTDDLKELQAIKRDLFNQFQYAPQQGLLLPPEMIRPDYAGKMPDYLRPLIQPAPGTAQSARLTHFSYDPNMKMTDPSRYGTGIKGAEAGRLAGAPDIRPRTYFYTGENPRPETGLGPFRYGTQADLYNIEEDPLSFRALASESLRSPFTSKANPGMVDPMEATTAAERLVKEYGYPGYMNPEFGAATVFQPLEVQRYARGGDVHASSGGAFEVPTPENLALDPVLAAERERRRQEEAQRMSQKPLAEKIKGGLEAAQTTASTVGRGVLRPFAELAGQAVGQKGLGERMVQSAPKPSTDIGQFYTGQVSDVMQEVGKFLEPAKIPQGPYMPELLPTLPFMSRPGMDMTTERLEQEFAGPPTGAIQLQAAQAPRSQLGMYSNAEQAALNLPQAKGTGNQFLAQLSKTPGVKPAELEWTGLSDFLKAKGDKPVTKAEIQDYLAANRVEVQEVRLGEGKVKSFEQWAEDEGLTPEAIRDFGPSLRNSYEAFNQNASQKIDAAKYAQYTLPGGENYREILLTLPTTLRQTDAARLAKLNQLIDEKTGPNSGYSALSDDERLAIRAEIKPLRNERSELESKKIKYKSSHYKDQPNILAHMRVNDRTDADGNKVLFVEELQSDWGQSGRDQGFKTNEKAELPEGTKFYDPRMFVPGGEPMFMVQLPEKVHGRDLFYGYTKEE